MSQTTIDNFFASKKRLDDQHASKKRKIAVEESESKKVCVLSEAVTSAKDDHKFPDVTVKGFSVSPDAILSTPESSRCGEASNSRTHKKDRAEAKEPVFSMGKVEKSVKKRLNMNRVKFVKSGNLSPTKKDAVASFERKGLLSPKKADSIVPPSVSTPEKSRDSRSVTAKTSEAEKVEKVAGKLAKLTPAEIKSRIGQVNKLSDLKAQLKNLQKDKNIVKSVENKPNHKRALFNDLRPTTEPIRLEVEVPKQSRTPVKASPIKASPRKQIPAHIKYADLTQPDRYLPLPSKYKFLTEVFRNVDQIVSMKFNRKEIIRVTDIKPAVQNIMRKNFTNHYLRQIRCVFPKAYHYIWEKINDRLGRHTGDYELHMSPKLDTAQVGSEGLSLNQLNLKRKTESMTPQIKVERVKLFQHALLTIVKDYHQDFLLNMGIEVEENKLTKWHRDFDIESCPEIDTVEFPVKPHVEKLGSAKDMIAKLAGVNPRLEHVLQTMEPKIESSDETSVSQEKPKLKKGLQGLPQHLIDKILAKEKEKRIRDMTQNKEERKDLELLKELVPLATVIVNCHRNQRKGAAVPLDALCRVTADSHGKKSVQEMTKLIEMFIKVVPECMEIKKYDKISYVKLKKNSPDVNGIRLKLEELVAKADVTK